MKLQGKFLIYCVAFFAILGAIILLIPFFGILDLDFAQSPTEKIIKHKLNKETAIFNKINYQLLDPEQAPHHLHDNVMLGYNILIDTPQYASKYVGDQMSCTNCHFMGGNTTGGRNGSISLAGIAAAYPDYNARFGKVITLQQRINNCFTRSMNGKPLPYDSLEMNSITAYLQWISKDFPIYEPIPWRGLKPLKTGYVANQSQGEKIYAKQCALCHGTHGEGAIRVPPIWGPNAYNDDAGLHNVNTLAAFIYANMPYENPSLTEEESFDVAAFIHAQPRPKYQPEVDGQSEHSKP